MKMNKLIALVIGMSAVGACAQDTTFQAKLSWVNSQGDLRYLTRNSQGYGLEFGAILFKGEGLALSGHADFLNIMRKEVVGEVTYDVRSTQVGLDLRYPVGGGAQIFTGPMLVMWDATGNTLNGASPETSWKGGWRLGLEVPIVKNWAASVAYTATEWKSDGNSARVKGLNPSNPSFLTFSAIYKF